MTSSPPAKKVLILALSGIGNFLMQSPIFATIKKAHPDWHLTVWVAPRGTKELAENDPTIDAVIEAPIQQSIIGHLKLIRRLRREKFDIALMLSPGQLIKGARYMFLAGIPTRVSHRYPLRSNPNSSFLLTHSIPEDPTLHDIEQNLALLNLLAISVLPLTTYSLKIPSAPPLSNIPPNKTIIGFHPGSARGFEWKRWPLEHWIKLCKTLIEKHNAFILIFGGPDDEEITRQLEKQLNTKAVGDASGDPHGTLAAAMAAGRSRGGAEAAGPTTSELQAPPESLLATAALMQYCKLFISNDSGLMHLAAASGVTTLGLFGPTDKTHTGPRGPKSHALRAPGTQPVYHTEKNTSLGTNPHNSLVALKPEQVLEKISRIAS